SETLVRALTAVREVTLASGALFIVNDSAEAARASGAGGVHLGQGDGPVKDARAILGADAVIGVSTHNIDEALRAVEDGADYISFGPIFPTRTKKDANEPKGLAALRELARRVPLPVVAIGGITERTAADALRHGASAIAIISDILLSGDMEAKAASIMNETKGSTGWEKKKA
ncbi:MAG: thiamine phosphate synthase, partial [Deltaproteobacteria bacterium]|nr:thiamine phosphate synthase [Deltaproteobacteria bacterium]